MSGTETYSCRGARALVLLHEQQLRAFVESWKLAKAANLALPLTDDPDYQSLETLLYHVLRAARGYMIWICQQLELPDPGIQSTPLPDEVESSAGAYLHHLLEQWRLPLISVPEERFHRPEYKARWGINYCIDAMLEHAVMHPMRHQFQLLELLGTT